jgi:hypothetical protein
MSKYNCKYEYTIQFGQSKHAWYVEGARMGVHVHITESALSKVEEDYRYYGGIEYHYRTPPSYMKDDAPSHHDCRLLGGICWHDGSSLAATEIWIPRWESNPHDHNGMFNMIIAKMEEEEKEEE